MTGVKLTKLVTRDGLELDGISCLPSETRAVVIHVHGKCGNFYQNAFVQFMLDGLPEAGIGFCAFNNRGHDCIAEGYRDGRLEYLGGSFESRHDDPTDVEAAVSWAHTVAPGVPLVLQGHSIGCDKVVEFARYARRSDIALVLLSPADSDQLQRDYIGEDRTEQLARLAERSDVETLLWSEYGISGSYDIPVMRSAMIELLRSGQMSLLSPLRTPLANPALIYLGEADPLVPDLALWKVVLSHLLPKAQYIVRSADHHFRGFEVDVITSIAAWILAQMKRSETLR